MSLAAATMDDSLKAILEKHWNTLVRYINPTPALITVLVEDKVLPAAMIDDIQKVASRREKNEILLKSIKLRGNMSYRKFRDAMMKCGQIFIADLLFEEEGSMSFVEESDFTGFPAIKLSLTSSALKQFVLFLDAKIRARVLKSEWKTDSNRRLDTLVTRAEDNKSQNQALASAQEKDEKIKQLTAEMNVKNDIIRSLSLDINILNAEVESFTQRYTTKTTSYFPAQSPTSGGPMSLAKSRSSTPGSTETSLSRPPTTSPMPPSEKKFPSRFGFFDKALSLVNSHLSSILGLPAPSQGELTRIDAIEGKAVQVQELASRLEVDLDRAVKDRDEAILLLLPHNQQKFSSAVAGVQRFLQQEQKLRFSLLKDIDRLSRKLRGISVQKPNSGLYALRQSAVTGNPQPKMVDYRFLSNHISLLEADAEHIRKKLDWKDADVKTLLAEVANLRGRASGAASATATAVSISVTQQAPSDSLAIDQRVS